MEPFIKQRLALWYNGGMQLSDCLQPVEFTEHYLAQLLVGVHQYVIVRVFPEESANVSVKSCDAHFLCVIGSRGVGKSAFLRMLARPAMFTSFQKNVPLHVLRSADIAENALGTSASHMFYPASQSSTFYLRQEHYIVNLKNARDRSSIIGYLCRNRYLHRVSMRTQYQIEVSAPNFAYRALAIDDLQLACDAYLAQLSEALGEQQCRPLIVASSNANCFGRCGNCSFLEQADAIQDKYSDAQRVRAEPVQKVRFYHVRSVGRKFRYSAASQIPDVYSVNQNPANARTCYLIDVELRRCSSNSAEVCVNWLTNIEEIRAIYLAYLNSVQQALGFPADAALYVESDIPGLFDMRASLLRSHFWGECLHLADCYKANTPAVGAIDHASASETGSVALTRYLECDMHRRYHIRQFIARCNSGITSLEEYFFAEIMPDSSQRAAEARKY